MFHEQGTTVVRKRLGFLSVAVMSLTAIVVTLVLTAGGIVVYGLNVIDKRSDNIVDLVGEAVRCLPEFRDALPPALADAINDERRPDYLQNVDVSVRFSDATSRHGQRRAVIEVSNDGGDMISLLSMRIVVLDADGDPIEEHNTWVATPIQIEDDWRGPLMPHETRRISIWCSGRDRAAELSHEITDIRVWRGNNAEPMTSVVDASSRALACASD